MAIHAKLKKREQEPIKLGFKKQQAAYASICRILERLPSTAISMVTAVAIYYADFGAVERPHSLSLRVLVWGLGVLVLLLIAKVIRQTPVFTILGLSFVGGALFFSLLILLGARDPMLLVISHAFEAMAYFYCGLWLAALYVRRPLFDQR